VLKVKKSKDRAAPDAALPYSKKTPLLLFLFFTISSLFLSFFLYQTKQPSESKPLIFYSNELGDDLKLTFLQAIRSAKKSIFLIIYGLTDKDIIDTLNKKINQGIEVRIFYDIHGSKYLKEKLPASHIFPIKSKGIMHKKVLVIDDETVFLGSANLTETSLRLHDNLVIGCHSKPLSQFLQQSIETKCELLIADRQVEVWSLPQKKNEALTRVISSIDMAYENIKISMFTLTCEKILEALLKAKNRGVVVEVAIDYYSAKGASKHATKYLKENNIIVMEGSPGKLLHHKWCLIDRECLILGSTNWTNAAFSKNDDCLIFIKKPKLAEINLINEIWQSFKNNYKKQ